jgi:tRNA A37 threonylcarbamoyladenosine biosynthesis protein TsaE
MLISIKDKRHLNKAAKTFLKATEGNKIFAFYGTMGAGKTATANYSCRRAKLPTGPTELRAGMLRRIDADLIRYEFNPDRVQPGQG